jgi:hypothetical protein
MPGQLYASDNHRNRLIRPTLCFVFEIVSQDAPAISFQSEGAMMPRRTIRFSAAADDHINRSGAMSTQVQSRER